MAFFWVVGNFSIDLYLGELKDKYYCLFGSPMTVRFRSLFAVRTMRAVISGAGMAEKGGRNNSEISPKFLGVFSNIEMKYIPLVSTSSIAMIISPGHIFPSKALVSST